MNVQTEWLAAVAGARLPEPALSVAAALTVAASGSVITEPPTIDHLANATDCDRLAVRRAVSDLVAAGFLIVGDRATYGEPAPLWLAVPVSTWKDPS